MLDNDIDILKQHILHLVEQSKTHTPTEMILGNIPHSTVSNFNYGIKDNPLKVNTSTLYKIVKRLDELEGNTTYYKDLCKVIKEFVQKNIMVDSISNLVSEFGLNYITLHKISDYKLTTPYRLVTLKQYAEKVEQIRKG
ncbi:hypothetical protein BUY35_00500 [Staphylococcus cohnii]|nr:hypothetical protein BUY35_00500 [Staphylococcus cohnii]